MKLADTKYVFQQRTMVITDNIFKVGLDVYPILRSLYKFRISGAKNLKIYNLQ